MLNGELESILASPLPPPPDPLEAVRRILARKQDFGITRLGSVTELDRVGIPVVQVVRPMSRSVTVNQGKGLTFPQAAISGLMESLEGWASERVPDERVEFAGFRSKNKEGYWSHLAADSESNDTIAWIKGWDLFSSRQVDVPLALVDTAYTVPSPHPHWLPRNTTGLAAGTSLQQTIAHGCFEALERHARCAAMRMPHFFDRFQLDSGSVRVGTAAEIVRRLFSVGFTVGIWSIPSEHNFPVYWCHVMESAQRPPLAPWPAEGFGCDWTHDRALTKALLEACQSRLGVISAAREDISGHLYGHQSAKEMAAWRRQLAIRGRPYPSADRSAWNTVSAQTPLDALRLAGAKAAVVVVLFSDESIPLFVARIVTPPLETNPELKGDR
ncbi:YcaO-like family protein [Sinorhizobium americanum]|uniref:Ribosomal protein S12 methylthiotransferase accessory factor n=1 Tax=Sinorhizobium americanum TaxID=194963 RepID=A0A4R2BTI1_9HYPH|nr:YcaO-like family protein [Sinorhizobium americanum]TCN30185.1 ribosomal protein S12 methylthiotransferase accessory factor [Sinorhizobium americanum]